MGTSDPNQWVQIKIDQLQINFLHNQTLSECKWVLDILFGQLSPLLQNVETRLFPLNKPCFLENNYI